MDYVHHLPKTAQQLIQVVGLRDTLTIMETWGGSRLDVPKFAQHKLTKNLQSVLGQNAVQALVTAWGGDRIYIPKLDKVVRLIRDEEIVAKRQTHTIQALAKEYGLTERWVSEILNQAKQRYLESQHQLNLL